MLQLFINDELADLADDSPIALTFQINNLGEVKNQQGNTSNQFKLPLTQRNKRILGFPDSISFNTGALYSRYTAKIVQDGLEIIPNGIAEISNADDNTAGITIISGNVDFFDVVDGKIYDLGDVNTATGKTRAFEKYDHQWTLVNVVNSQNKNDGWIWSVVDYGKLEYNPQAAEHIVDIRNLRPGFFLKTAIETFAANAGFKIDPNSSLLKNPLYNRLIVQFANDDFQHSANYQNSTDSYSASAIKNGDQSLFSYSNYGNINFTNETDPSGSFNHDTYIAKTSIVLDVKLTYGLLIDNTTGSGGSPPFIKIQLVKQFKDGSIGVQAENEHNWGDQNHKKPDTKEFLKQSINHEVSLLADESIFVRYYLWPGWERIRGTFYGGAQISFTNKKTNVILGQKIQCERIFPDISQKDLLKDTLQRFGIICQTDDVNRSITLASLRDIVDNIPVAKNWSAKCVNQGKDISFRLGNYAQINHLKYKEDDNVSPVGFANAQIIIGDKGLPAETVLIESQFAPTLNRPYIGGTAAQIKKIEEGSVDFSISTEPRLLIDEKLNLKNMGLKVKFVDGSNQTIYNDNISIPYFYKSDADDLGLRYGKASLHFDDIRKTYYAELEKILQQTKKIVRYILLTPRDIMELDLLIPVYLEQDSAYYYINKIDNWRKGQPTKVELVRL
ncbi:MAG: hypothetical protein EOP46_05065 [Sphingobacteriaceae bacterium]|nr:MAG: hypothetical protein EOP46_05065 [Sphingobacteriaceae bacterium]